MTNPAFYRRGWALALIIEEQLASFSCPPLRLTYLFRSISVLFESLSFTSKPSAKISAARRGL